MKAAERLESQSSEVLSDILHSLSQPLTALECGLEIALHRDRTAAQFRKRVESLLVTTQILHQRLREIRALKDAAETGDRCAPVALESLLTLLGEDFGPVAKQADIGVSVDCKPVMVAGNAARLRNGFFHLLDFLLRECPSGGRVRVAAGPRKQGDAEIRFRVCGPQENGAAPPARTPNRADISLRIAERTFLAAGGTMGTGQRPSGEIAGAVRLRLAEPATTACRRARQ